MQSVAKQICYTFFYIFIFLFSSCFFSCNQKEIKYEKGAVPPDEAVSTFETEPGFKVELVAAEPLIADPVDMEIDEYGRMYIVEMHGYPLDKSGSGKIKLLADENGDGMMDKSTLFADKLVLPNGIMRWKKGVIVTDAPYVLYFEDTDNDGRADIRDTLLTGFSLSNPHINVNNPVYSIDNWIHLAHRGALLTRAYRDVFGDEGSEIYFNHRPDGPRLPKNADSRSVRFRPDTYQIEMTATKAQFGHSFDAWGRHLFGDNQNHAYMEAIAAHYLSRNPALMVSQATEPISDHGDAAEIFQITTHPERQMFSGAGTMTSASGIVAYTGGAFPPPFDKDVTFICESVSNLVHADKLRDTGATFIAGRVGRPKKEFFASKDAWSRPVNLYIGPDGALYVLDYYRRIIEHPEWMSDEAVKAGGLYDGMDMGRVYRISAADAAPATWTKGLRLGDESNAELVKALNNRNSWWRIHAQRLLVDRGDTSIASSLEELFDTSSLAEGRLHALWTLEGLNMLKPEIIKKALGDPEAGIRENAIRLAELHLKKSPGLASSLLPLQNDPAPKVRFQLLCTLGEMNLPEAALAGEKILFKDINDKWIRVAALSSGFLQPEKLIASVLKNYRQENPSYGSLLKQLAAMMGAGDEINLDSVISNIAGGIPTPWQAPILEGLADGLRSRKLKTGINSRSQSLLLQNCFNHPDDKVRKASFLLIKTAGITDDDLLQQSLTKAAINAANKKLPDERRVDAVNILSLKDPSSYMDLLKKLIVPQEHPSLQIAAIKTLSLIPDETVTGYLVENWPSVTPGVREEALKTFMISGNRKKQLINAIASGKIQAASVGWLRSSQLMQDDDDSIRNTARALFTIKDQEKIIRDFQKALSIKGNADSGRLVFEKNCALCHQIRGEAGTAFGPDLGTVQGWLSKDIMANILEPGLSIAVGFDVREVQLNSGETVQGIIASETPGAITIKSAPGVERTLNRQDIQSFSILDMSLMPSFSQQLNHQQMADLIAFLQQMK
ncbi:MAG: c-type cytochrome [Chitinophagaceae bacterium]|nr:c-type cytochrome [Chitinophagaceae bacterium]